MPPGVGGTCMPQAPGRVPRVAGDSATISGWPPLGLPALWCGVHPAPGSVERRARRRTSHQARRGAPPRVDDFAHPQVGENATSFRNHAQIQRQAACHVRAIGGPLSNNMLPPRTKGQSASPFGAGRATDREHSVPAHHLSPLRRVVPIDMRDFRVEHCRLASDANGRGARRAAFVHR